MPANRINIASLTEDKNKFTGNEGDAIPTMAYAITAYKRANGAPGSKYWDSYSKALQHIALWFGKDAANHVQEIAVNTNNNGDLSESLRSYAKNAIATKQPITSNSVVNNLLVSADQGEDPLSKWRYGFDEPDNPIAGDAKNAEVVLNSIRSKFKK